MVNISLISFYLGLKFKKTQVKKLLKLLQPAYIVKIMKKYHFNQAKLYNILMKEGLILLNKGLEAYQAK